MHRIADRSRKSCQPIIMIAQFSRFFVPHLLFIVIFYSHLAFSKPQIALSALLPEPFSSPPAADSNQLLQCVNDVFDDKFSTTWEWAMDSEFKNEASLCAAGVWWSQKQASMPLTIVTQLSLNRLGQLWAQCKSFPGTISAAVHVGFFQEHPKPLISRNNAHLKNALRNVSDLYQKAEKEDSACNLDLILVYEIYQEKRAMLLYPVNQLRNIARLQAKTELIGLMDVDMLISTILQKWMAVKENLKTVSPKEIDTSLADQLSRQSKSYLIRSIKSGTATPFDAIRFPIGHNTTNFTRWYSSDDQYQVAYASHFEPWIIANRKLIPWHDVRFRGYGSNKIVHIAHINASGFKFVVHPTAFIVHRLHEETPSRKQLVADKKAYHEAERSNRTLPLSSIYGRSRWLWDTSKQQMDQGLFHPVLDSGTLHCIDRLSWWQ